MPTLTISEKQAVELFEQLPGRSQKKILYLLAGKARSAEPDNEKHVMGMIRQLPLERKKRAIVVLADDVRAAEENIRAEIMQEGETRMRQVCSERGLNWDAMSDDEREEFVARWIEEDEPE